MPASSFKKSSTRSSGFAIVVVLGALVLLVGVALAFFSNSLLQKQISQSSASLVKTDLMAQGALEEVLSDLKTEIEAGSHDAIIAGTDSIYLPSNPASMVPALAGSSGANGLENLVKRSSGYHAFYPSGMNRASTIPTTDVSGGGRAISASRWNKPLLLPATSVTNPSPPPTVGFEVPYWVYVARDGANPKAWSDALRTSKEQVSTVVGRYAFTIYDEGGVLDVNAAGSPSDALPSTKARKGSLAYADLTGLFVTVGFSTSRADEIVDALVKWRNEATLVDGVTGFDSWAMWNSKGFVSTANTKLANGTTSDRIFTSRQQLQRFLLEKVATAGEMEMMQKAFRYLGTFSRDLNQPSFVKTQAVNAGLPGYVATAPKVQSIANGGNNQETLDALVNPAFPLVRVQKEFTRNDGSKAVVGEPLVKSRFPLSRLAWLTCKGPSAARAQTDADIQALINTHHVPYSYLQKGTVENIRKHFGLSWVPDAGSDFGKWVYDVHNGPTGSGPSGPIMRLGTKGDTSGVATLDPLREPNFFELLKSSIGAGSKARAATLNMGTLAPADYHAQRDVSYDYAIMQLAANIITQSRVDGFGVRLSFNDGALPTKEFYGVLNLPYIYRARWGLLKIRNENPVITGALPVPNGAAGTVPASAGKWNASQGLLMDPGVSMVMLLPEVWNPHDQNVPLVDASLRPVTFRIVADSADPDAVLNGGEYNQVTASGADSRSPGNPPSITKAEKTGTYGQPPFSRAKGGTGPEITGSYEGYLHALTADQTAMVFSVPNATMFREPTLLARYGVPAGSNLRIDSSKWVANVAPANDYLGVETSNGKSFTANQGFKADVTNPLVLPDPALVSASTQYVGFPMGLLPSQWLRYRSSGEPTTSRMIARSDLANPSGNTSITLRLQYQDPANPDNWITYDTKYVRPASAFMHNILGNTSSGGLMQGIDIWASFTDPRSSRFGAITPATNTSATEKFNGPGSAKRIPANNNSNGYAMSESVSANAKEWLDAANNVLVTNRPSFNAGFYVDSVLNQAPGWTSANMRQGLLTQNSMTLTSDAMKYSGVFGTDPYPGGATTSYYTDADNVVRRAMGAYTTGNTTVGLPMASTRNPDGSTVANQSQSRPWVLQRPFRSVAELGYVFSGTPWKNLDFFTPESGDAGLLDVFCVNETENPNALVAGKVNLNTRQAAVLKAIIANAYRDEAQAGSAVLNSTAGGVADQVVEAILKRTDPASGGSSDTFTNLSELVGKWEGASNTAPVNGSTSYDGLSKDLTLILTTAFGANTATTNVQRFRESAVRPLASMGTTRVWNLMIDLVVQTGRFPPSSTDLSKFVVEGEKRCWVHVAIDRLTGQVLDKQTEVVTE
ncbi:MAG: hypothetical protein ACAI34_06795 [Verrucomicrobium sp.]